MKQPVFSELVKYFRSISVYFVVYRYIWAYFGVGMHPHWRQWPRFPGAGSCFKPTVFRASHDDYAPIMEAAINYFRWTW